MKRKLVFLLFLVILFFGQIPFAHAFLLEEQQISSKDGSCRMRYLTEKNVKGWYFTSNHLNCPNDGWLDGYHDITIYDAFSQINEKVYGYFSYGYWTGDAFVNAPFLTRFSEELGVQKATFLLAKDDLNDMDYIGQMVAKKNQNGDYGSFHVCNPFRLLIVTEQIPAFANKKRQQMVYRNIEKHVRSVCPMADKIMLFVSPVIEPKQEDIVFYSEIDLKNHTSEDTWQEDALKKSGHYAKTIEIANLDDVVSPNEYDLDNLRKALSKKIDLLPFKNVTEKKHSTSFADSSLNKNNLLIQDNKSEEQILKTNHAIAFDEEHEIEIKNISTETKSDLFSFPVPQKSYQYQEKSSSQIENEPIMHLCVLSKIKKSPIDVSFVAHVVKHTNKESYVDLPIPLILKGKILKSGWYKISGSFDANKAPESYYGVVRVKKVYTCSDEKCGEKQ